MSSQPNSSSELVIRPARDTDTQSVFQFLREVWDGEDYLPSVWEEWLDDPRGYLAVVEMDEMPVATGRVIDLGWGEFWMEGLRVAASYRGMGIASQLHEHLLEYWLQAGGDSIGYLTHRDQSAVHHLAKKANFQKSLEIQMIRWEVDDGGHSFKPYLDLDQATQRLAQWSTANGLDGRMEVDWTYPRILHHRLRQFEDNNQIWSWRDGRAFAVLDRDEWDEQEIAVMTCVSVKSGDYREFMIDTMALCSMLELDGGRWFAPKRLIGMLSNLDLAIEIQEDLEMIGYVKYR